MQVVMSVLTVPVTDKYWLFYWGKCWCCSL